MASTCPTRAPGDAFTSQNLDKTGDGRGVFETKKNRMSFIISCGPVNSKWCTRSGELGNINQVQKGAIFLVSVSFIEHYSTAKPCSAKTWEWGKNGPFSLFRGEKMGKGLLRWNNGASKNGTMRRNGAKFECQCAIRQRAGQHDWLFQPPDTPNIAQQQSMSRASRFEFCKQMNL